MKAVTLVFAAAILIMFAPAVLTSVTDFRTTEQTESHDVLIADITLTAADIVLSQDLWNDATYNVEVSSNITADAPVATAYVPATNTLTVSGLDDGYDRRLTVVYKIAALDDYIGADAGAKVWPLMLILGVIGVIAGAVYNSVRNTND